MIVCRKRCKYLLHHGADTSSRDDLGRTIFHRAVLWDLQTPVLETTLRRLCLEHAVVGMGLVSVTGGEYDTVLDLRDCDELTAMSEAVRRGRETALILLLECGARVDSVSNEGYTVLHDAVLFMRDRKNSNDEDKGIRSRMVRIILQHLERHGDFRLALIQDKLGESALHKAIQYSVISVFYGDEPWAPLYTNTIVNCQGERPLHVALRTGKLEVLQYLLHHNANVSLRDACGRTPLTLACEVGYLDAIFVLFTHGQGSGLVMV